MIAIIVAKSKNNVIGKDNDLPWHLPADLRHFKELTLGNTVIMGRNTCESIYNRLKGPLPDRRNVVVTSNPKLIPSGFETASSIDEAINLSNPSLTSIFLIGGRRIFEESLQKGLVDTIYLTEIHTEIVGDTLFPTLNNSDWREVEREKFSADGKNGYDYSFVTLERAG